MSLNSDIRGMSYLNTGQTKKRIAMAKDNYQTIPS